jgi:hypothetical protein
MFIIVFAYVSTMSERQCFTHYGHFEYLIMSFELANAPATFQAYINWALAEHMNFICVVYLNDILIYSQSKKNTNIMYVKYLSSCNTTSCLSTWKCVFSTDTVEFLRFIVSITEMTMNSQQIDTIKTWLTLKTFQKVQVFLKFVNFYRHFIKAYLQIVSPLTSLLKGSKNERRQSSLSDERCCKDICLSQESLYDSTHSCSLWFRAQELNEDWCFEHTVTEFTLSCRCQSSDTLLLTDCESCSQQKKVMRHMILSF